MSEAWRPILSRLRPRRKPSAPVGLEHDQRDALGARAAGLADHDDQVGGLAVGDERLLAVDDVVVALLPRGGAHGLQVGPGAGFGHRDGTDPFAARELWQPALLLLLGAVIEDVMGDDRECTQ